MPHVGASGGFSISSGWRLAIFYLLLLAAVVVLGVLFYGYLTAPLVRFQDYGYPLEYAVQPLNYKESIQLEIKGKSAAVDLALPSDVALEEAQASMIVAMKDLYERRIDLDVITVYAYNELNFARGAYYSIGYAVWGPEGRPAPVVHQRSKDNYAIKFHWNEHLPTIAERRLARAKQEKQETK